MLAENYNNGHPVQIWNATWEFTDKSGHPVYAHRVITPLFDFNYILTCIEWHVMHAADIATSNYKEKLKTLKIDRNTNLPYVRSIHYIKQIGESNHNRHEYLKQFDVITDRPYDPDEDF